MTDHHTSTVHVPGLVLTDHEVTVPLDHASPDGEQITVFAREVADPDGRDKPFLVFLQGGPGSEAPRPTRHPTSPGWLDRALQDYRVLMFDQRGTGRSTPIGTLPGLTPQQQADHLAHFRADSIVRDAELVRQALGVDRWSVLGQSFGGFCSLTYLSFAPEGLREVFFTGGVPPVGAARRRRVRRDVPDHAGAQPPLLRPLPGRPGPGAGAARAARRRRRRAARTATCCPRAGSGSDRQRPRA